MNLAVRGELSKVWLIKGLTERLDEVSLRRGFSGEEGHFCHSGKGGGVVGLREETIR